MRSKKIISLFLVLSIALMLISMIGSSLVQNSGGTVEVKNVRWQTSQNAIMSGLLLIPDGVTAENPAPAVVVCHGFYNNKEMQDSYYIELSRRGFVVLAIDMLSHGESEKVPNIGGVVMSVNEAVDFLCKMACVDTTRIGVEGHSLGGASCNTAASIDSMYPSPRIAALLFNGTSPTFVNAETQKYANIYGSRDVAIIATQFDEFGFISTGENGETLSAKDFIYSSDAQSFLYFGVDPENLSFREANIIYSENIDEQNTYRAIYNPAVIHPWSHFSKQVTACVVEFFDKALDAPVDLDPSDQIWPWKEAFNCLGLVGIVLFVINFTLFLLYTPFFAVLKREDELIQPMSREKSAWLWGISIATVIYGSLTYLPICTKLQAGAYYQVFANQNSVFAVCVWAASCGLFSLFLLGVYWLVCGKKHGTTLRQTGVVLSLPALGKTILLAAITAAASYAWVFFAKYFFNSDFRLWVLAIKYVDADTLLNAMFPYAPLLLIYFTSSAFLNTCFDNAKRLTGFDWNDLLAPFVSVLPALFLLSIQYISFIGSGTLVFDSASGKALMLLWLIPLLAILPVSAFICRKLYKATKNPYLPATINTLLVAVISCGNTCTWL